MSTELPEFSDKWVQYFNPSFQGFEIRRKLRAEGNLSITESMEKIDAYLKRYQTIFIPNKIDKTLILFPYLFNQPKEGDKVLNTNTKETYIVDQIIKNPNSGIWEGLIKFRLRNAPSVESLHLLELSDPDTYIRFNHEVPDQLPNPLGANLEKLLQQSSAMKPTITWTVKSVEPGTLGAMNSSRKEFKPRLRESVKDPLVPGHTVEIYGQVFDNVVQFDCWSNDPRTSDRLVRWYEQFMSLFAGSLRRAGLNNLMFLKRPEGDTNQTWRQAFSVKGTQYLVRTEQLEASYSRDILNINISISSSQTTPPGANEIRWIADQMVSGNLSSQEYRSLFYRSGEYLFGDVDIRQ